MPKFQVGDEFLSEGHRFRVKACQGVSITAEEVATGQERQGLIHSEQPGEADLEWVDGDPRWHQKTAEAARLQTKPLVNPPGEPTGPSRFDRNFDDDLED